MHPSYVQRLRAEAASSTRRMPSLDGSLDMKQRAPYLIPNRKLSETAPRRHQVPAAVLKFRSTRLENNAHDLLQLDALLLWLLLLLLRPHTGERMSGSRR